MITAIALCVALAGTLLIFRALPPNPWFGLRTKRTLSDPLAWYRAHRAFGWVVLALGLAIAVLSMWPTYPAHPALGLVCIAVSAAAFIWVYRRYAGNNALSQPQRPTSSRQSKDRD